MHTILYVGTSLAPLAGLGTTRPVGEGETLLTRPAPADPLTFILERDTSRALRWLHARPVDAVVVDARAATGVALGDALTVITRLFSLSDLHGLGPRERTLVAIDPDASGARVAFEAGRHRLPAPLVAPEAAVLLAHLDGMLEARGRGKIALCLAGGGIEGLLYELGVLRAIDHFLRDRRLVDIDLFFGISAGSVLASMLANGISPDQIARGLRHGSDAVPRIGRADLFDPNIREMARRAGGFVRDVLGRGDARNPVAALYRALPSGVFAGDRLRAWMQRVLTAPGRSDHFEETRRPLFIGATDQDTSEAVVFGEPGWTDVPIHKAVRASCALAPFYAPENIGGRWYIDGAFTRTTNMRVAVRHGATLCLLVDPLVPIYSPVAGYVHARGGLFGAMQGLKALINQRFDKAAVAIAEMFPNVAFHLFRPEAEEMRVLSGSPMKFLYREEIEHMAYEGTVRRLRALLPRMQQDFARHGVRFQEPALAPTTDAYLDGVYAPV
jgi:predicted acylesterase/phospholipase RssA